MIRKLQMVSIAGVFGFLFILYYISNHKVLLNNDKDHSLVNQQVFDTIKSNKEIDLEIGKKTTAESRTFPVEITRPERAVQQVQINTNNQKTAQGIKYKENLYIPFSFLEEYYGHFGQYVSSNSFKWYHVNPAYVDPETVYPKYNYKVEYLSFHTSNVPKRARVKCICAKYEVPITTQWDPKGYYYPTQIAQYGLSFISRYYLESKSILQKKLTFPEDSGKSTITSVPKELFVIKIKFKEEPQNFEIKVLGDNEVQYTLTYKTDNSQILRSQDGKTITHGLGKLTKRTLLTRDLSVDLLKGLSFIEGGRNGKTVDIMLKKIISITITKVEGVSELLLLDKDFVSYFMAAADWFVKFQDESGGWKVNVKRKICNRMEAAPGWYSAMGQGQAISLLTRVYLHTKKEKYLDAALKATLVFHRTSTENGVKADLFGLPWYEEYPTQAPSYVLNGFMFSLFGLYDLWKVAGDSRGGTAQHLFNDGFTTLEKMIPLYDNGHGTFYDLRHLSIPGISPNRARWQYHRVHLEQLTALLSIKESKVLKEVLQRWTGYVSGILSRHN
ncbi:D-glucuronyl C5-epimerase-like [Clytia hemisphaerica]|uniref:heparosan-N-sulfate-glucuronate 5-epimerase n=1 Tax=Clytia hemisphaerica TaxID=252671 RepID=A0A7M6DQL7_9CNID|eukprot:TCONS_00008705-protein